MIQDSSGKNILITGGTVFVSRYAAEYYAGKGYHVYVLNRNTHPQPAGVTLIEADRHHLGDRLRGYHFDAVLDITAYTAEDVSSLLSALGSYDAYILISSSAVYPEYASQPFTENTKTGANKFWGNYGIHKIEAEQTLLERKPDAYILRPPYLYGPMNHIYREAFVFDCALNSRKFYLPQDGEMKLQFFHVNDLCRFMDIVLEKRPGQHIFNVGNQEPVTILDWVTLCYQLLGKRAAFVSVPENIEQRNYFSFYNYAYYLDVQEQAKWMPETKPLRDGLQGSLEWYLAHSESINRKPYIAYIDSQLKSILDIL